MCYSFDQILHILLFKKLILSLGPLGHWHSFICKDGEASEK